MLTKELPADWEREPPELHRNAAGASAPGSLVLGGTTRDGGRGVFAARAAAAGEFLLTFQGPLLELHEVRDFTHCLETAPGQFLGPSGGVDDFVNHSCSPNAAVRMTRDGAELWALDSIERGEEITFDYSTVMLTEPTRFACRCPSDSCRGVVTPFAELPARVRRSLLESGMVPGFVAHGGSTPSF